MYFVYFVAAAAIVVVVVINLCALIFNSLYIWSADFVLTLFDK